MGGTYTSEFRTVKKKIVAIKREWKSSGDPELFAGVALAVAILAYLTIIAATFLGG